jgi:hypothetical protein
MSVCNGAPLPILNPTTRQRRVDDTQKYREDAEASRIAGWMHMKHVDYVEALTLHQHEIGLFGAVGEIGVHHGMFSIAIAAPSYTSEPFVAVDLFEDGQDKNVDSSGQGDSGSFLHNLRKYANLSPNDVAMVKGDSSSLKKAAFSRLGLPQFRFLSVDGGHSLDVTLHDLMLASCLIMDGGIVVLDDLFSSGFVGVIQAATLFSHGQTRLQPFLYGQNKMYLTTSSHIQAYVSHLKSLPKPIVSCREGMHRSRISMGPWEMCHTD